MVIQELIKKNILQNINSYNNKMSISKVVKFFERHGLTFSKTRIQHYVRVGVVPPLEKRRYYQKKHIIIILLVDSLKEVYSLEELTILLKPIFDKDENFDYMFFLDTFINTYNEVLHNESREINYLLQKNNNRFDNEETLYSFVILNTVSKTAALKALSKSFI